MSPLATRVAQALGPGDISEIDQEIRRMSLAERIAVCRIMHNRLLVRNRGMQLLPPMATLRDVVKEVAVVDGIPAIQAYGLVIVSVDHGSLGVLEHEEER